MADMIERQTIARVYWRLVPLLFAMMLLNYLDRINVGFAALRMNADLDFSPTVFGTGASIFFFGYIFLQVPSNLVLYRVGARLWLFVILVVWGSISAATAFVHDAASFYALRFALGLAEGGFLPGAAVYVTHWFPEKYRARAIAGYIIATSFSSILGGPLATAIMTYADAALGLHGWQWMFLFEGLPAILLAFVVLNLLTEQPAGAAWLGASQREWLTACIRAEQAAGGERNPPVLAILVDSRVWSLGLLFGSGLIGLYGLLLWTPQIIKTMGQLSDIEVGFLSSVPSILGVAGAILVGRHSDRVHERKGHMAGCYIVAGVGLLGSALVADPVTAYILLCVGNGAVLSASPLFWTIAGSFFTGAAAAISIAFVNVVAQVGGVGPYLIGRIRDATGSFTLALISIAGFLFLAAAIALTMRDAPKVQAAEAAAE
jgi:MFS transporter, ACS family, tartrate transporter